MCGPNTDIHQRTIANRNNEVRLERCTTLYLPPFTEFPDLSHAFGVPNWSHGSQHHYTSLQHYWSDVLIQQYNMVQLCNSSLAVKELTGHNAIRSGYMYVILGRMTSVQKTTSFDYISAYRLLVVPLSNQKVRSISLHSFNTILFLQHRVVLHWMYSSMLVGTEVCTGSSFHQQCGSVLLRKLSKGNLQIFQYLLISSLWQSVRWSSLGRNFTSKDIPLYKANSICASLPNVLITRLCVNN